MPDKKFFIFSVFSLIVLCANLPPLFAKAPTTPKILFTSTRDGNREIYVMNPDGSKQVNLTQHRAEDLQAVWSPTGEEILFVSDRDGIRDLYLMKPDGSNVRRVFKKIVYRYFPAWAPDGKQIAYMHKAHDLRASILRQIVDEAGPKAMVPALSPTGKEVLYKQEVNGNVQIFKVDVDSGVQTQLTHIKRNFGGDWFDPAYTLPVSPQPHSLTTTWGATKTHKLH